MNIILNILWLIFGGLFTAIGWYLAGVIMLFTIVGIPWARSCFAIGYLCLMPFGNEVIDRKLATGEDDIGTGTLGLVGNIIWIVFGGIWLAIGHLLTALSLFISIIGIPFALQHLKLAQISLAPIGKIVVPIEY